MELMERITEATDPRLAPYARVRDADLAAWPDAPNGLFMAESRAVIAAAVDAGCRPRSVLLPESFAGEVTARAPRMQALGASVAQAYSDQFSDNPGEWVGPAAGDGQVNLGRQGRVLSNVSATENAPGECTASVFETLQTKWPQAPVLHVSDELFTQVTGYKIIRGPVAAFERPPLPDPVALLKNARRVAVLEDVGNFANIGSAFRAAHAFGIDAVLVTPSCHDPLFRRASRTSQGTVLQVPWTRIGSKRQWAEEGVPLLHAAGFKVAALALEDDSLALGDPRLISENKLAMVLGTEGAGLFPQTIAASDYTVKIPMAHGVDSLNVAAASAVAFWELRVR